MTICADTKYLDFICDGYARGIAGTIYIGFGGLHKNGQICINYTLFSSVWSFEVCLAHEPYIRQYQKRPSGTTRRRKPSTKRGRTTIQISNERGKKKAGRRTGTFPRRYVNVAQHFIPVQVLQPVEKKEQYISPTCCKQCFHFQGFLSILGENRRKK